MLGCWRQMGSHGMRSYRVCLFFFFWVGLRRAVVGGAKGKEDQGIVVRKG